MPRNPIIFVAALVAAALALSAAGCGGGSGSAAPVTDKAADAEVLNTVLARQLAAVRAFGRTLPLLDGDALAMAREFRVQEQEHVDLVLAILHGLGEKAAPEEEEIEAKGLRTQADALGFLYEIESVSVADGLHAVARLSAPSSQVLLGSIATNQAQHLVRLRRALGASPAESIPGAFEDGTAPPPAPSAKMPE